MQITESKKSSRMGQYYPITDVGHKVFSLLTGVFNAILIQYEVPYQFKLGIIVPIPKGNKDAVIMDNNRGITLLPVMEKIFEKSTLQRFEPWAKTREIISDLQGALQSKCSSLQLSWLLREAVNYNVERGSSVYVALLDMQKAFDSIWTDGLFYKMYETGMDGKLWRTLRNSYKGFKCRVNVDGVISEPFEVMQSVHQGAPWSMMKFAIFINELIVMLKESGDGAIIDDLNVSCPTFADDSSIVCLYKACLQRQLNMAYNYSTKWRLKFNASKSAIVLFGDDEDPNRKLTLGQVTIPISRSSIHMGLPLTPYKGYEQEFVRDRVSAGKRTFHAVQGLGSRSVPLTPQVSSKLYWNIAVPRMTYGLELLRMTPGGMANLETAHSSVAKQIQGIPKQSANICIATMGWRSLEAYIDLSKLLFIWRIMLLRSECIYKSVAIRRISHHIYKARGSHRGPTKCIIDIFRKYDMFESLYRAFVTGTYMGLDTFKLLAKKAISKHEYQCFVATCLLYRSIPHIIDVALSISMWFWWQYASLRPSKIVKCKLMGRILYCQSCVQADVAKYSDFHSKACPWCDKLVEENASHMLFECEHFNGYRQIKWDEATSIMPNGLKTSLNNMSGAQKLRFILSGLNGTQLQVEWIPIYDALLDFCYSMYNNRRSTGVHG
jgi:hypothetical protein